MKFRADRCQALQMKMVPPRFDVSAAVCNCMVASRRAVQINAQHRFDLEWGDTEGETDCTKLYHCVLNGP